jgi:predicted nucleic acid-binding protein
MSRSRSSSATRVVLDPALVLRALLRSDDTTRPLRQAWQQGLIRPLLSAESAAQLVRALAYPPLGLSDDEREELLADYLPYVEAVRTDGAARPAAQGLAPAQRPQLLALLQLARQGEARWIITGGQDLLTWAGGTSRAARELRELCTVVDVSSWYRVLTPSQRDQLLC